MLKLICVVLLSALFALSGGNFVTSQDGEPPTFIVEYPIGVLHQSILPLDVGYLVAGFGAIPGEPLNHLFVSRLDKEGKALWSRAIMFPDQFDILPRRILRASDGNYFLITAGEGINHPVAIKLSVNGKILWKKAFMLPGDDRILDGCVGVDGGLVLVGSTTSFGNFDAWVVKLDSDGKVVWSKTMGGTDYDQFTAIIQSGDGFILGGRLDFFVHGGQKGILLQITNDGVIGWKKITDGTGWFALTTTADGNLVVSGDGDSDLRDIHNLKMTHAGKILWKKSIGRFGSIETINSITGTSDGGIVLMGETHPETSVGFYGLAVKLDRTGRLIWSKGLGESLDYSNSFTAVAADLNGGFVSTANVGHPLYPLPQINYGAAIVKGNSSGMIPACGLIRNYQITVRTPILRFINKTVTFRNQSVNTKTFPLSTRTFRLASRTPCP